MDLAGRVVPAVRVLVARVGPAVPARVPRAIPAMVTVDMAQGATNLAALVVTAATAATGPAARVKRVAPEARVDMIRAGLAAPVSPAVKGLADQATKVIPAGMTRSDLADTTQVVRVRTAQAQLGRVAQVLKPGRALPGLMPVEPRRTYPADPVQTAVDHRWAPMALAEATCPEAGTRPVEATARAEAIPPAVVTDP